ncbi:uncharacterized protein LAESUDRAFT_718147 [Laetiporus sulphureus 93-53]|uniref:Uncharacterized protein n=1 Tax=Laetiporus sulphureus 93-53 TaxID=1314785 RepID=A0A165B7G0_9APHY|nr:uncharacterized protein LAESUDRAFT_718147 [Laetiporus sulphureus 93-53]KZT00418.1 hypothetical protein LAESUDRAFT_718147 [Laetiporus sulphureus 93-53]
MFQLRIRVQMPLQITEALSDGDHSSEDEENVQDMLVAEGVTFVPELVFSNPATAQLWAASLAKALSSSPSAVAGLTDMQDGADEGHCVETTMHNGNRSQYPKLALQTSQASPTVPSSAPPLHLQ